MNHKTPISQLESLPDSSEGGWGETQALGGWSLCRQPCSFHFHGWRQKLEPPHCRSLILLIAEHVTDEHVTDIIQETRDHIRLFRRTPHLRLTQYSVSGCIRHTRHGRPLGKQSVAYRAPWLWQEKIDTCKIIKNLLIKVSCAHFKVSQFNIKMSRAHSVSDSLSDFRTFFLTLPLTLAHNDEDCLHYFKSGLVLLVWGIFAQIKLDSKSRHWVQSDSLKESAGCQSGTLIWKWIS